MSVICDVRRAGYCPPQMPPRPPMLCENNIRPEACNVLRMGPPLVSFVCAGTINAGFLRRSPALRENRATALCRTSTALFYSATLDPPGLALFHSLSCLRENRATMLCRASIALLFCRPRPSRIGPVSLSAFFGLECSLCQLRLCRLRSMYVHVGEGERKHVCSRWQLGVSYVCCTWRILKWKIFAICWTKHNTHTHTHTHTAVMVRLDSLCRWKWVCVNYKYSSASNSYFLERCPFLILLLFRLPSHNCR